MRPAHPTTEETERAADADACAYPSAVWVAIEMWFASWLSLWRPLKVRRDVYDAARPDTVPESLLARRVSPYALYLIHAPSLDVRTRRALARQVCACLAHMRTHPRAREGFIARHGSRRVIHAKWRRLFRVFVDFARSMRGDRVLPRARVRLPEGGCGPPGVEVEERLCKAESGPGTSPGTAPNFELYPVPGLVPGPLPAGWECAYPASVLRDRFEAPAQGRGSGRERVPPGGGSPLSRAFPAASRSLRRSPKFREPLKGGAP